MPLAGGPSDKIGNRYELWWTVSQLVKMLFGELKSIRIEDPGIAKAEFVAVGQFRELHQAKRSHESGRWSLAALGGPNVQLLQAIGDQLDGNDDHFVFVSSSDARELAELSDRAKQAETPEEFQKSFLAAKESAANFERLSGYWKNRDIGSVYDILRRVEIHTISERQIEEKVEYGLKALFLANPSELSIKLRGISVDSVHQTITRDSLVDLLAKHGFRLRRLTKAPLASVLVREVTRNYVEGARKKLIQHSLLPIAATQNLLQKLGGPSADIVLTGKAGTGKTGCVIEFVEAVQALNIPVLAFRLDRLKPVSTTWELGQELGLEESPALVLAEVGGPKAILVIDQLDAVGTTSGGATDLFDAVENMLAEARGLRVRLNLHIVVVCRKFDLENDHRLRRMFPKENELEVAGFSMEEVKQVLSNSGYNPTLFLPRQLLLLQIPQNLSLFLESSFELTRSPKFDTTKELFDRYWDEKRRAVSSRTKPLADHWMDVIGTLCDEMTETQQLSVSREKLDRVPNNYLAQMISEGLLAFDGRRYGFGHESFFDYCFARAFVAKRDTLVAFLTKSEQHLFRRAQVRQILVYLRDAEHARYCDELKTMLENGSIRFHLKDLALALLADVPDPTDDEWIILEPWIGKVLESLEEGKWTTDKLAELAWRHFFGSSSWFDFVERKGLIQTWLMSGSDLLVNAIIDYLRLHQRHSPDKIAAILDPYTSRGGVWQDRLRHMAAWADHANSRSFFELILRLVDNGTLDTARGPIAVNSTFWDMFYDLETTRPEWIPELMGHWLRRRFALLRAQKEPVDWNTLFSHDSYAAKVFQTAGTKAPVPLVKEVLPAILEITDAAINEAGNPPKRDSIWPVFIRNSTMPYEACMNALVTALATVAADNSIDLQGIVTDLKHRDTYVANYLLLNLYAANAHRYADEAIELLSSEPWRFECGFSDSAFWCAMQLIRVVAPVCRTDSLARLEMAILGYTSFYEKTAKGSKYAGNARFSLLSAIPSNLRSQNAKRQYGELERKFGEPDHEPRGIHGGPIGSPIPQDATEKMTDEQWLKAIAKHNSEEPKIDAEGFFKGGARQFAMVLKGHVEKYPERFAALSLKIPVNANPIYLEQILCGLKGETVPNELKIVVCRKAYQDSREECGSEIADVLGTVNNMLPDDCVKMLEWLATEHPDPEKELWQETAAGTDIHYYRGDILNNGINTTRGRAAEAIQNLIVKDVGYIDRFYQALGRMVKDKSLCVRSCVVGTLYAVAYYNQPLALELFTKMDASDDRLLGTAYAERFIGVGLRNHFPEFRPYVEQMLRSNDNYTCEAGARLASIAALHHADTGTLDEEAMAGNSKHRLGVAQVASANISTDDYRDWCEKRLVVLFNDEDPEVRREAATCFGYLGDATLESYGSLISTFCDSRSFQEDSFTILHTLENSLRRLPGITCDVCEKFLSRFADEAKDIRTSRAGDVYTISKLIFRTYHQHRASEWAGRCLDLIDRMCLEGIADVNRQFEEFER
jgi:hypothetical protein